MDPAFFQNRKEQAVLGVQMLSHIETVQRKTPYSDTLF